MAGRCYFLLEIYCVTIRNCCGLYMEIWALELMGENNFDYIYSMVQLCILCSVNLRHLHNHVKMV